MNDDIELVRGDVRDPAIVRRALQGTGAGQNADDRVEEARAGLAARGLTA